jgi:hypothetical protein
MLTLDLFLSLSLRYTNTHTHTYTHITFSVAMAILGGYGGLFLLFKMKSAVSKKAPEKAVVAPATSSAPSGGVPSLDSPEFGEWLGSNSFNAYVEKA